MTSTIQRYQPPANGRAAAVSQATSIEQSRAIADVQAAVTVAQNCPRDMSEAEREMEYVCGRLSVAEQAFYRVQNRGTGPSVHLMRELARIWGNIDYGVKELSRDDHKGESEVLATCWDMQKNTRSSRTFIVPHARMAQGSRKQLDDLQDIYLNNQNIGARAVRECIETVLPKWFTERAQEVCRATLANGEGEPLTERIQKMVDWFRDRLGVSQQQLEANVGRKRGQWTADDVAQLKISSKSIMAGEISRDEVFPMIDTETVDDIACTADADAPAENSKLKGKVKQANPKTEPAAEATQVEEGSPVRAGDTNEADTQGENTPASPDTSPEPEPPGAPTADTPGQTDRVAAALGKARGAATGERQKLADTIAALLGEAGYDQPQDALIVASHVLKLKVKTPEGLSVSQLKTVHNSLEAWRKVGTLTDMVTGIVENAEPDTEPDSGEQQTLDSSN